VFDTDARQRQVLHADTGELAEGLPHAGRDLVVATGKNDQRLPVGLFPRDEFQQQQRMQRAPTSCASLVFPVDADEL